MNQKTQVSAATPCDELRPCATIWNPGNTTPPAPGIYQRDYRNTFVAGFGDDPICEQVIGTTA